jgi:hypothetical protein
MGSVTVVTKEKAGELTYESQYTFSDSVDFFAWEADKREALSNAVKGLVGGFDGPMVADIQVKKKDIKH